MELNFTSFLYRAAFQRLSQSLPRMVYFFRRCLFCFFLSFPLFLSFSLTLLSLLYSVKHHLLRLFFRAGRYNELFMNSIQEQVESTTLERPDAFLRCPIYIQTYSSYRAGSRKKKKGINIGVASAKRILFSRSRGDIDVQRYYYK